MDGSSVLWMYHSHFVESTDINTGLVGPLIVTRKGSARPDGSPKDVDREFITDFSVFDETDSWFFEGNLGKQARTARMKTTDPLLRDQNLLYSINGYIEGNLPMLTMRRGNAYGGISSRMGMKTMCTWPIGTEITPCGTA